MQFTVGSDLLAPRALQTAALDRPPSRGLCIRSAGSSGRMGDRACRPPPAYVRVRLGFAAQAWARPTGLRRPHPSWDGLVRMVGGGVAGLVDCTRAVQVSGLRTRGGLAWLVGLEGRPGRFDDRVARPPAAWPRAHWCAVGWPIDDSPPEASANAKMHMNAFDLRHGYRLRGSCVGWITLWSGKAAV